MAALQFSRPSLVIGGGRRGGSSKRRQVPHPCLFHLAKSYISRDAVHHINTSTPRPLLLLGLIWLLQEIWDISKIGHR